MSDLVLRFHQVQLCRHRWVVGKPLLPHSKQPFDQVLGARVHIAIGQHRAEPVKQRVDCLRCQVGERCPHFLGEADCDLDAVVAGLLEQEDDDLKGKQLVDDLLVDEVRDKRAGGKADGLVIALEGTLELRGGLTCCCC